jgi:tetratricopeptide (TPR) repeat protein
MADTGPKSPHAAMREALRRMGAVLAFARRLSAEQPELPPGLVEDFRTARADVEKLFVRMHEAMDHELRDGFRNLLTATRSITATQILRNLDRLDRRVKGLLNRLMMEQGDSVSLTAELPPDPPVSPAATPPATPQSPPPAVPPSVRRRRFMAAAVLILTLGGVGLAAAWALGAFRTTPITPPVTVAEQPEPTPEPEERPPQAPDPETPFDPEAHGYSQAPRARLPAAVDLLEVSPEGMVLDDFGGVVLGMEALVAQAEPSRPRVSPTHTARILEEFARSVETAEPQWRERRVMLLEGFTEHVRAQLGLVRYPDEGNDHVVLMSDVLYASGGPQMPLVVTLMVLAQSSSLPMVPAVPHGPARPLLAQTVGHDVHAFNGETHSLRDGRLPVLTPADLVLEVARHLRPTMESPEGRLMCDVLLLRFGRTFTPTLARQALQELEVAWLEEAPEDDDAAALRRRMAELLAVPICRAMIVETVEATHAETLKLYRLAQAVGEDTLAALALELLGRRASRGQMLDGVPLSLAVGELLMAQGRDNDAQEWFRRAMRDHPGDARPVMRLIERAEPPADYPLLREAYARGERSLGTMRLLAARAAEAGDVLAALAVLDELCQGSAFDADDLEAAVLLCLELNRPEWGLERLAQHAELVRSQGSLLRLDLLLELSVHGLSERAQGLAQAWRRRGESDPMLEGLLRRHGR